MKRKILLFPLFLLVAMLAQAEVTRLKLIPIFGTEQQYTLSQIGKILFVDDVMQLYDDAGELLGFTPVEQIGKIVFGEQEFTDISNVSRPKILVFPNPAQESLFVRGIEGTQTVRIYALQGQLLQSAVTSEGEANLHVGGLQKGTYLLQVGAEMIKFIKE